MHENGGAVERIDDPSMRAPPAFAPLSSARIARSGKAQPRVRILGTEADQESKQALKRELFVAAHGRARGRTDGRARGARRRRSTAHGSALDVDARKILASNGKLHRATRETLAKAWPEADWREAEGRAGP